jgi:hypothetical protein
VLIISLFLPWFDFFIFSFSLIGMPEMISDLSTFLGEGMTDISFKIQLAVYIGYVYIVLAAAGLYFNYTGDIQKSKLFYYSMIGYFALVLLINMSDISGGLGDKERGAPSIFDLLGMGFYVFIASYIGNLKYLKEESQSEIIEE